MQAVSVIVSSVSSARAVGMIYWISMLLSDERFSMRYRNGDVNVNGGIGDGSHLTGKYREIV